MKTKFKTREQWLNAAIVDLTKLFKDKVPQNVKVSCGFPSRQALGARRQRVGECWSDKASEGKVIRDLYQPGAK